MRRKVIQIAGSTQLISLPRKWATRHNIAKGEELEITEDGNKIVVSTDRGTTTKETTINISGLAPHTIHLLLQSAYRKGHDTITVTSKDGNVTDKAGKKYHMYLHLNDLLRHFIGLEIMHQKETSCLIKDMSKHSVDDFDSMVRRVFLLTDELCSNLKNEKISKATLADQHHSLKKFANYCIRLINKQSHNTKTASLSNILELMYRLSEKFTLMAEMLADKKDINKETSTLLTCIRTLYHSFHELYYKFDTAKASAYLDSLVEVEKKLNKADPKNPLVQQMCHTLPIFHCLVEERVGIEY